jgi:hypothetical protein
VTLSSKNTAADAQLKLLTSTRFNFPARQPGFPPNLNPATSAMYARICILYSAQFFFKFSVP